MPKIKTKVFAHRGASGIVEHENTIEAFEKAVEVGSDGIELDVRKTKDNVMVIRHDATIDDQAIADLTYSELLMIAETKGFHLPTFAEALVFCQNRIFVDIELKEGGYEQEVVDLIKQYLTIDNFYIRSFHVDVLRTIKQIAPEITTVLLICGSFKEGLPSLWHKIFPRKWIKKSQCDLISPHYRLMIFGFVLRMRLRKIPISVWTVNTEKVMKKMYRKKVAYVITNYPNIALKVRDQYQK